MERRTSLSDGAEKADAAAGSGGARADDSSASVDSLLRKVAHVSHLHADAPLPRVGQVIGQKYRIEERLGRGGMGVVFRATHVVSQKPVALKWMLRPTTDGAAHRRLLREALAAGRIAHPNVVDVYDVGEEGVSAYLVMELLRGEALRARLERGPLGCAEAIDLLLPALRGVSAAHRAGVIHRDLKPDNIFLCTGADGAPREAKVLDFGVSAVLVTSALDPTLTDQATILGTPAYMSPEQLAAARDTDERTDVYAFGVILYEALTGRLPFVADSYSGLVLAVAHDPPRPPRELCPSLPSELERVILQALSKRRDDRPASVDALHDALAPFGSDPRASDRQRPPDEERTRESPRPRERQPSPEGSPNAAAASPRRARPAPSWLPVAVAGVLALALLSRLVYVLARDEAPAPRAPLASAPAAPSAAYSLAPVEPPLPPEPLARADTPPAHERDESERAARDAPRSCDEARRAGQTRDGLRRIDPDGGGPLRPFEVFCAGMADVAGSEAPREYLPLAAAAEHNSTTFRYGQSNCPCPDLVRRFSHVRIAPSTLTVDPADGAFAAYDRPLDCERRHRHQCGESINLAWGGAGSCAGVGDTSGSASIDLNGTGFVLAPDARFVPAGFGAAGRAVIAPDRRTAQLSGGGLCGSLVPQQGGVRLVAER